MSRSVVQSTGNVFIDLGYAPEEAAVLQMRADLMADLRDAHGEFVPFMGRDARSTVFPALLARLHKVPIIAIRALRVGVRQFRIDAVHIPLIHDKDRKIEIRENTLRIQKQFEVWIKQDPEQWMWGHNRWDTEG